jgi:hypothetical protein
MGFLMVSKFKQTSVYDKLILCLKILNSCMERIKPELLGYCTWL